MRVTRIVGKLPPSATVWYHLFDRDLEGDPSPYLPLPVPWEHGWPFFNLGAQEGMFEIL